MTGQKFQLVVHGGAGTIERSEMTPEKEQKYRAGIENALRVGREILQGGGSSLDAVETAVRVLEDDPHFNAGKGSVFTSAGTIEMDAAIMDGKTLIAGAVAAVEHVRNPIALARAVMEKSKHVMMVGAGAEEFAKRNKIELADAKYFFTQDRWDALQKMKAAEKAGARIFERTRVTSIVPTADGWSVKTASAPVRAAKVLVATNAYGGALQPILQRTYVPLKVFQIATAPLPQGIRARLLPGGQGIGDTRRNLFTCRFDAQNRLISGGMHIVGAGAEARVPQTVWRRLARQLDLPDLPPLAYSWTGVAAVEPDFLPRLIDLGPGLIAGFACNGRGIAMTTAMGKILADWADGADARDLPLPFAPPSPIPFHGVVRYAPNVLLPWSMLRDRLEKADWIGRQHDDP